MGKYGIGKRVRDDDGDEGVIINKRKGERLVEYDNTDFDDIWWPKKQLTPAAAKVEEEACEFSIGDRVKVIDASGDLGASIGDVGTVEDVRNSDLVKVKTDRGAIVYMYKERFELLSPDEETPTQKPKFKVGDKVRNIGDSDFGDDFPLDSTGVIIEDNGGGSFEVKSDNTGLELFFLKSEIELVTDVEPDWTPSKGDRVLATGRGFGETTDLGVVSFVNAEGLALVEFHDGWEGGHGDADNRWWFNRSDLKPAPVEPEPQTTWTPSVGDKVRIARNSRKDCDWLEDEIGKTVEIESRQSTEEGWGVKGSFFWWPDCDLDPVDESQAVDFKVGDKVQCLEDNAPGEQFTLGATYEVSSVSEYRLSVVADDSGNPNGWGKRHFKPAPTTLKIEAGKIYLDTNGQKAGPMKSYCDGFIEFECDGRMWLPDGTAKTSQCVDLVSLVTPSIGDTVTLAESATVTALNGPNASLKLSNGKGYDLPVVALVQA